MRELAAEGVRAPGDLLQSVMAQIRELACADWSAVLHDPAGRTRIAARVAAPERAVATSVGTAGSRVVVGVQIAVDYGVPVHAVAAAVRERIATHIAEQTGLVTTEVNVAVIDVRSHRMPPRR